MFPKDYFPDDQFTQDYFPETVGPIMAGEFLFQGPLSLSQNEIRNFAIQVLATAPATPVLGQEYYDSAIGHLRVCTSASGPTWEQASGVTGGGGTVTTVSIATANGFAGSVSNPTSTPTISITTSVTGLLKGNGTAVSAAAAGTDYLTPTGSGAGLTNLSATSISSGTLALARGGTGADLSATGGANQLVQQATSGGAFTVGAITHTFISDFDTGVRANRLDQMAAPTASVSFNSQKITNLLDPTAAQDAATKAYADALVSGLDVKQSVRAASTANVSVTYNATGGTSTRGQITVAPNTLDGVTLVNGNRILLKDQTTAAQDGIWVVTTAGTGANGVWDRATDFDQDAEVTAGAYAFVEEGTANADSGWVLITNNPIVIGGASGTALTFTQFSGAGNITAGAGLTKTGNTLDVVTASTARIVVNADSIDLATGVIATPGTYPKVTVDTYGRVTAGAALALTDLPSGTVKGFAASIGDGASTSYVVTHNLGTKDVHVKFVDNNSPFGVMETYWEATTTNSVTVFFGSTSIPSTNRWRVVVLAIV